MPFLPLTDGPSGAGRTAEAQALADVLPLWEQLAATTGQADPFCCAPAWQLTFRDTVTPGKKLFFHTEPGGLAVFTEVLAEGQRVFLAPPENGWLFGCPLLGPAAGDALAASLAAFDAAYPHAVPHLIISGIRPRGPLAAMLLHRFGEAYAFFRHGSSVQCAASLAGGLDGYLSRRSANHRAKLKKAARKAEAAGVSFTREHPATPGEAEALYARMQAVEARSWKGLAQCGMGEAPAREFYALLVQRLAQEGKLRAIMAQRDGRDIGFIFGGLCGGGICGATYRGQQFSYAAEEQKLSLGNLLQLETLKWLCEEGAFRYDMGPVTGPRMEYKRHWTEENHEIQTWLMVKKP
ncbi:MAG: GNAT family N-acetyltransferase [Desulfovibrio sp.]|uniref:GNAT family N-acetyltransferase n=1 Tax=Desulfovibrio sp. TaxID=885 RepID=UPI001A70AEBE|nr:GNAT family N-acetyltransferase [Desulfovibrio sp.]MBD5417640.1 GNAT family N-acetyltransferase [Desulfovibrio sp.]